jgi:hypothetical protein
VIIRTTRLYLPPPPPPLTPSHAQPLTSRPPCPPPVQTREMLEKAAATSLNSKLVSGHKHFFAKMVVDAVLSLDPKTGLDMLGSKKVRRQTRVRGGGGRKRSCGCQCPDAPPNHMPLSYIHGCRLAGQHLSTRPSLAPSGGGRLAAAPPSPGHMLPSLASKGAGLQMRPPHLL